MGIRASITVLDGDGIGPEVTAAAKAVIDHIAAKEDHEFSLQHALIGGAAIDESGDPFPPDSAAACLASDAVLLGAVGGPKWDDPNAAIRPEQGLLKLRRTLKAYANLRPVKPLAALASSAPIRSELLEGVDLVVVRELTGGIYFGDKQRTADFASDVCLYERHEVERIVRFAANLARARGRRLCSVDKANILETSRFWRDIATSLMAREFPDIEVEHMLVDAAAMHLLRRPAHFDVIVTDNMFGDILTDEASMLAGSMGLLPSASLGDDMPGLYEPIHGSAPDIAGQGIANPCAMIASVAMMFRHSFGLDETADRLQLAIEKTLERGIRTADIAIDRQQAVNTREMTNAIIAAY